MKNSISAYRLLRVLCALVILTSTLLNPVYARIKQTPLDDKPLRLMEQFREREKSFPKDLTTDKDVFVVIYATATSSDFYVLARPSIDPEQLAHTLESAVQGTPLANEPVLYMQKKGYTWADAFIEHSRMWSRRAEMRHPVGPIISRLSAAGFKPHILLCTSRAATLSHKLHVRGYVGRKWFIAQVSPKRTDLDFSLISQLTLRDIIIHSCILFVIPALGIVAFPVLIYIARSKRNTPEGRRSLFTGWYFWVMIICSGATLAPLTSGLRSPQRFLLPKMWFGEGLGLLIIPLSLILPWIFIGLSKVVARLVFRGESSESIAMTRRNKLWSYAHYIILFCLFSLADYLDRFFSPDSLFARKHIFVVFVLWFFMEHVCNRIARIWPRLPGPRTPDDMLLHRLSRFALQLGLNLRRVEIVDPPQTHKRIAKTKLCSNGVLLIQRELVEKFSPEELDFTVNQELAYVAKGFRAKSIVTICAGALLFLVPGMLFVAQPLDLSPLNWRLWPMAAGLVLLIVNAVWLSNRRAEEADREALHLTNDPKSAAQAIMKTSGLLDFSSEGTWKEPDIQSFDTLATSRLRWLKKHSEASGLETLAAFGKVEQNDTLTIRAQELASRLGVKLNKIEVVTLAADKPMVNAGALRGGKIVIGHTLISNFSSEELDFVLAHELAHLKRRHVAKMLILLPVGLISLAAGMVSVMLGNFALISNSFWMVIVGTLLLVGNVTWLSRQRELDADRIALRLTRNLPTAISALNKLAASNPMNIPEEYEGYLSHPKQAYRVRALRREALKLGLADVEPQERIPM